MLLIPFVLFFYSLFSQDMCGVSTIYLTYYDTSVSLTSPSYPKYYEPNIHCIWYISGIASTRVVARIHDLQMENGYDFVIFGNGVDSSIKSSLIAKLTGSTKLKTLTGRQSQMWVEMITDRYVGRKGFRFLMTQTLNISCKLMKDLKNCKCNILPFYGWN